MTQQTPIRYSLDIDHDLDRSAEQQQNDSSGFRRDSSVGQFQFENDQHQEHHFNELSGSQLLRDSQCSEDGGVFSYSEDYRMRQSGRSDEECELQDIGGNADMSDRHLPNKQPASQHKTTNHSQDHITSSSINIVQKYQPRYESIGGGGMSEQNGGDYLYGVSNGKYNEVETQQFTLESIPTTQVQGQQPIIQQQTKQALNSSSMLPIHTSYLPLSQGQQPATTALQISQQTNGIVTQKSTQRKQILTTAREEQKIVVADNSQLSNQPSNNPVVESGIYNKHGGNKVVGVCGAELRVKQQKIQQPVRKQKVYVKPAINLVEQNQIEEDKKPPSSTSIRDWFRPSAVTSKANDQKPSKQYNPNINQIPSPIKGTLLNANDRKQLQSQMQGIKQSLNNLQKQAISKASTQPIKQSLKPTKTNLPQITIGKNTLNNNLPIESVSEDLRMMLKICIQKKKQNYSMLREWDNKRAQTMNTHRNMVQMLQNQIDKRIKSSLQNFQIYSNFFRQKLKQQQKFATSPVINTKYALQNNSISKNIYINCSVILNSLSEQNQLKCKKVQDFIAVLKNDILKELVQAHSQESQRELLKVREKISTLKNSLKKCNQQTEEKSQELAKMYTQSEVHVRPAGDFYSIQLQFLRSANQQLFIQKRLGENCLQYYHTALNQQFKRAKVIRQALLTYSKALQQTYNIQLQQVGLQQLSKTQQIKLIEEFYSLQEMFDQRTGGMLKKKYSLPISEDVTIAHVTRFIQTFEYEQFNNRMLLLKEFSAKYYSKQTSKSARQQNCTIVITVDFYLHIFFSPDKSSLKPDITLKITHKQLEIKSQKQQFVDIVKKEQKRPSMISYFWQSKNQRVYKVKFPSKDSKELFCDYLNKLLL